MGGKQISTPVAIGIAAAVLVLIIAVGMLFISRKSAAPDAQQSVTDLKKRSMKNH